MTIAILQSLRVQSALIGGSIQHNKKTKRKRKCKVLNQPIYKT
jgi:hypothetical protein